MREFLDALCYVISHDNPIYLRNIGGNLLNVLVGYVPLLIWVVLLKNPKPA